jgi:xylulokinase
VLDPSAVLAKLMWLRETEPDAFLDGWRIAMPQALILRSLGATDLVVDETVAAHVGLLDVATRAWSDRLLDDFDVPAGALPRLVPPGACVGALDRSVAARLGLPAGIPLVAAASDGVCTELGAGVVEPGHLYAYLGTAATVAGPLSEPELPDDEALILMPGSTGDRWRILGLAMAGGSARAWLMTILGIRDQRRVERSIAASPPGARGVLFVPTLAGATAPVPDGRARGVFAGLSLASRPEDLTRAVHEGVALELRWLVDRMRRSIPEPTEVRFTGGGSRSDAWSQILADVLAIPVARIVEPNPGVRGAAAYALAAIGREPGVLAAAARLDPPRDVFVPRSDYGNLYDEAVGTYALVRQSFHDGGIDERLFR